MTALQCAGGTCLRGQRGPFPQLLALASANLCPEGRTLAMTLVKDPNLPTPCTCQVLCFPALPAACGSLQTSEKVGARRQQVN